MFVSVSVPICFSFPSLSSLSKGKKRVGRREREKEKREKEKREKEKREKEKRESKDIPP